MNTEQKAFLALHGVASVHDLSEPLRKLEYTEIDPTPDPASASSYSEAQTLYLGGRSLDNLDDLQRQIFAGMGPASSVTNTTAAVQPAKRSGPPRLDVAKLQSMPSSPTARLEVFEWFKVLEAAHQEAQSGIPEHLRSTRYDVERAHMFCAPYLD